MRLLLMLTGCCITLISAGQSTHQSSRIQVTYEKAGQYLEQAVAMIEAVNLVGAATMVEYRAGRSVTMLPGFETRLGSTFIAHIRAIDIEKEGGNRLRLIAFPNPFEQSTIIDYYLPTDGKVNVWITDAQGKIVHKLVNGEDQSAGQHHVEWRGETASSGIYIPIVEANQQKAIGRLVKK